MAHHVIYVPGIGDHRRYGQPAALYLWRPYGLHPHYLPLGWHVKEGFDVKLARLTKLIDDLLAAGHTVSLVGVSAGASAVLAAYAERPAVHRVVTICGKILYPERIGQRTYDMNPDFEGSMALVPAALSRLKTADKLKDILTIYSPRDTVVATDDAQIDGAPTKVVGGWSHGSAIFVAVIFGTHSIAKFLRST
jgi:pimeloyl-ACP methyl ester carboxylesterase